MEVEEAVALEGDGPAAFINALQNDAPVAPVDPNQNRRAGPFSSLLRL